MQGGRESVGDVRAGVVARLRARRGELAEAIFARVRDRAFGAVGVGDAEYVAGLRAAVGAAVEYGLEGIERGETDGSPPTPPVPPVALEQARRAARLGVSLDTVLRRYVVGHTLLGEFVTEEADRCERDGWALDHRGVLRGALRAQAAVLDRLLGAVTSAYGDELRRAAPSPGQRRVEQVRRLLEHGVLGAGELDYGDRDDLDSDLGYALDGWHVGVIAIGARAELAEGALRERAEMVGCRLLCVEQEKEEEGCVWAWLGAGGRLMLADVEGILSSAIGSLADQRSESAPGTGEGVLLALGEPSEGFRGWRLTHLQARAALVVARRRPQRFTRYRDVALLAGALKDELLGGALLDVYVAPLRAARNDGAVLRQTLRAYLATERSVSSTAAALGVGRKTVENRLQRIEERLGRSLHPFPAELEVALLLDELTGP